MKLGEFTLGGGTLEFLTVAGKQDRPDIELQRG
jgi:hypothetical protein